MTSEGSLTELKAVLAQAVRERDEALEEQAAAAEVLKVISRSTFDLPAALDRLLETACRLCEADIGTIRYEDGAAYRLAATFGCRPEWREHFAGYSTKPDRTSVFGQTILKGGTVHIPDVLEDRDYARPQAQKLMGLRAALGVPLTRDGRVFGVVNLFRTTPRAFTQKQIALVETFADQAVIAIENARLLSELRESLQQQTATADVLKVISSSIGDLGPVFKVMLENAVRLCEAKFGTVFRYEDNLFHRVASTGTLPKLAEFHEQLVPFSPPEGDDLLGAMFRQKAVVRVVDEQQSPMPSPPAKYGGARSIVAVPMLKDDALVGAFVIYRQEVRPFTDKQIELVQNFAAQAVIAIENTRLLNELRQRTDDLTDSLEQQTATSEVLRVISSSPGELQPVFDAILENAVRICEARFGTLTLFDGNQIGYAASYNVPAAFKELRQREPVVPLEGTVVGRVVKAKEFVNLADVAAEERHKDTALVKVAGARSVLGVPMLKEEEVIGAITIYRTEVRPFSDKQVKLLTNFAAQAVIAIENARLLNELRQRTDDLTESLEQQTATSEVLKVISSSSGELEPVFKAMLANATRLCEASYGTLWLREGDGFRTAAIHGALPSAWIEQWRSRTLFRPTSPDTALVRVSKTRRSIQVPDLSKDPSYLAGDPLPVSGVEVAGIRTLLVVPMVKESEFVGAIAIYRREMKPFTEQQIELVSNFAKQAVIAIENARLLSELRQSLQQQTGTADVLKAISRSTFDLHAVLQTLIESAARLCDAEKGNITREKDGVFYRAGESYGYSREFLELVKDMPIEADRGSATGRALLDGHVVHILDVKADPEYTLAEAQKLGDYRTVLAVPMLREGAPIGVLTLTRSKVRPFTDKQIELVTTFADQAAIAIENVRLFESVEARTRELTKSLEDLRTAQDRLVQTEKLASLGQLTAGIAHEIKNPLNFVNNFSGVSIELIDELKETLRHIKANDKTLAEINELTNTLRGNLDKIVQHGSRADSIVKNMLQHSRQGSGEHRPVDINVLVEESLNLAYHGARAERQGFNITLERSLDPAAGEVDVFPQDITRVLLNLISNGFYAATKRRGTAQDGYEPTLAAATKNLGDRVEIRIRDNGTGIPPGVKDQIFNPFFTTKPAGEGTGLGLSISHDIIVKQHAGSIEIDTRPGEFTEFRIILPRAAASLAKSGGEREPSNSRG